MVLYLSKRKKIISVALLGLSVAAATYIPSVFSANIFSPLEISYSTATPSTVLKNKPNDDNFSPVANTEFIDPPKKQNLPEAPVPSPGPKIVVEKPIQTVQPPTVKKIDNPIPQTTPKAKPKPTSPIVTPIRTIAAPTPRPVQRVTTIRTVTTPTTQTRPATPTFAPPAPSPSYQQVDTNGKYGTALQNLKFRASTNVGTANSNIARITAEIKELERQMKEAEKSVYWRPRGRSHDEYLKSWNESYTWQINNKKYELERQKYDLKYHSERVARFSAGRLNQEEISLLEKGYTPDKDTDGWEPRNNIVKKAIKADNAKGIAPYDSPWPNQDSTVLSSLSRPGWSGGLNVPSSHVNDAGFTSSLKEAGIPEGSRSIRLIQYKKNDGNNAGKNDIRQFKSLYLDSSDSNALSKFETILQSLAKTQTDLKEVVLQNVKGEYTSTIEQIISKLPSSITSLRLFVEDNKGLEALSKLENHKLTELSLYSNAQKETGTWAINPNGLKNVDFIKWDFVDKANINLYNPGAKLPGSIRFDTLSWTKELGSPEKINEGLKIAFGSKINQRVFQGVFGGRGGYPPNLDFSKTDIKTFNGIKFDEANNEFNRQISTWETDTGIKETANFFLRFSDISFGIDSNSGSSSGQKTYTVKLEEFDGQFQKRLNFGPYEFSNIYIKDKDGKQVQGATLVLNGTFSSTAKTDLEYFLKAAKRTNAFSKIQVDSSLASQLGSSIEGLTVETKTS
ncbi:putative immunoglobulin-blocking virulence protein [Mesomycoplasma ovipneumoniae]|uniref:Immunoglobulin-blocking virulence protein n=1 Tax=Mesomycoplasma ovipneumoniae TaxID=29562 RepID=A0AAJ2P6E7_9BACT|nr:putative immunoglobulin-blocking virulence protein [Mesomycoplasma ovipneumoniae]MDW2835702.1 putative immunoglobulin-blocking virulence protein [Mesomycoplasma ovipneumoniae]MDW2892720.1 putative immunoglobulin-blocking virulence protein [Mesomycoplasma ovipneumoniae]MDW2908441.1 putative immunoglobulin-blocking virulence protein [Mesomycoplasma ovipneumoniae]